jgi:hypothetical protein
VNNSASYLNTSDSTATDHQYYLAADGSSDQTTDSSSNASTTASGDYTASGGVNAVGQQTDGSSYLETDSVSHNDGTLTTVTTGETTPVQKSVVKTDGGGRDVGWNISRSVGFIRIPTIRSCSTANLTTSDGKFAKSNYFQTVASGTPVRKNQPKQQGWG